MRQSSSLTSMMPWDGEVMASAASVRFRSVMSFCKATSPPSGLGYVWFSTHWPSGPSVKNWSVMLSRMVSILS